MVSCKNCNYNIDGNYCSQCGQKAATHRINWHYLQEEAKYTFFHINGGFFYTLKQLFTRPGHMIREFLEGKRIKHYKPLLLLFVLAGLYGFALHYIDLSTIVTVQPKQDAAQMDMLAVYKWMGDHYALTEILFLPLISFCTWLAFRGWGYNFIEHLILNAYTASLRLACSLLLLPILFIFQSAWAAMLYNGVISLLTIVATVLTFLQFFDNRPAIYILLRGMLSFVYIFILTIGSTIICVLLYKLMF